MATVVLPLFIVLGLATRVVVVPTIIVTNTAYFLVHRKDSSEVWDIPYMYLITLLLILLLAAGTLSFDMLMYNHF